MASMLKSVFSRPFLAAGTSSRFIRRRSFGVRLALFSTSSAEGPRGGQDNGTWWNSKLHIIISLSALSSLCLYHYLRERKEGEALLLPVASCLSSEGDGVGNGERRRSDRYNFLAETVEKVSPSVVLVESHKEFDQFEARMVGSNGSGFIVGEGNYVMTNAHAVIFNRSVSVRLYDGRELTGTVTDIDQVTDLALIKLDLPKGSKPLPSLEFGSSADLRPGEWVIALGSPLSLSNTITSGIVSSVHRPTSEIPDLRLQLSKPGMEYIQTDAVIMPSNFGGPLVNLDGEVIGVNVMSAGLGISFAIPSDFAKKFLNEANKQPSSFESRYDIGVSMFTISPSVYALIQSKTSFNVTHGVVLVDVCRWSPADLAGLKKYDIIVAMNSKKVSNSQEIFDEMQKGRMIEFEILRGNEKKIVQVKPEPF